jgi:hypothetical protein
MKHLLRHYGWALLGLLLIPGSLLAQDSKTITIGEFNFTPPAKWESEEVTSPMRKAQLKVTDAATKEVANVVFFQFGPGAAGGVQANVDRWLRQFSEPREQLHAVIEEATVGKTKITYVQAEGTYNSGMPGGQLTPMADYGLAGAIIESGDGDIFVRMTGPKKLVKASFADFKKMIASGPKKDAI